MLHALNKFHARIISQNCNVHLTTRKLKIITIGEKLGGTIKTFNKNSNWNILN